MRDAKSRLSIWRDVCLVGLVLLPAVALAHHPMGGGVPDSAWRGLLSGLGHPIIGLQHLFFILAVAALAVMYPRRVGALTAVGFVFATLLGATTHVLGFSFLLADSLVAISLIVAGVMLAFLTGLRASTLVIMVTVSGLFHGHAYAEAIIGATAAPILAYLLGFSLMHLLLILGVAEVGRWAYVRMPGMGRRVLRLTGGCVALVGAGVGGLLLFG
ncbi:urease accessory protein [Natronocella acetinitrilica]|uniref:Urease accessory protein n=1 Tax=Natronocella acetinitrilica TaxID=414046 RepID=A0AAE3G6X3_9GAMM|nr:HupE/UreJ family protein [Natronocella acetinitrilica]MCP1676990.1 urease accessory protein [Natronocella acetinitrilica]